MVIFITEIQAYGSGEVVPQEEEDFDRFCPVSQI